MEEGHDRGRLVRLGKYILIPLRAAFTPLGQGVCAPGRCVVQDHGPVGLSNRTLALLAQPFEGGDGPSHSAIELIWTSADAFEYLGEGNKLDRVLSGLRALQSGRPGTRERSALPPDDSKLRRVASDLATRLMSSGFVEADELEQALGKDGLALEEGELTSIRPADEPADRLASHVISLFGARPKFGVALNHYEQAARAFDRGDWEAANAQFRSAFDATYDAIAHVQGCPPAYTGGKARRWLQDNGLLEIDEADLLRAFSAFAGRAGSHAGLSDAADAQLRRHFATALIAFAVGKFG